jgi:hypothetical protein
MEVRAAVREARATGPADDLARIDRVALGNRDLAQVGVQRRRAVCVRDRHVVGLFQRRGATAGGLAGMYVGDLPGRGGEDLSAWGEWKVVGVFVETEVAVARVPALAHKHPLAGKERQPVVDLDRGWRHGLAGRYGCRCRGREDGDDRHGRREAAQPATP